MSFSRKLLKVISLISIVLGVSYLIVGVLMEGLGVFGGSALVEVDGNEVEVFSAGNLLAGIAGITAIVYLVMGLLGLRGANVPSKIGPVYVLSAIGVAMGLVNVVFWAWQGFANIDGGSTFNLLVGLAASIVVFVLARNIKKERELWH